MNARLGRLGRCYDFTTLTIIARRRACFGHLALDWVLAFNNIDTVVTLFAYRKKLLKSERVSIFVAPAHARFSVMLHCNVTYSTNSITVVVATIPS